MNWLCWNIPSPDPNGYSSSAESRRPAGAGGDRDAVLRSYMAAMQAEQPNVSEMTPEQIATFNKPDMDINDAFFGSDRKPFQLSDLLNFLSNFPGGK